MEWVKCSNQLPEKSGRYLVYEIKEEHSHNCAAYNYPIACCESNIAYFRCFQSKDWEWNSFDENNCNPTHWMPLPNPPEHI